MRQVRSSSETVMPKACQQACVESQDVEKEVKEVDSSGKTKKRKVRDVEYCYEAELEGEQPVAPHPLVPINMGTDNVCNSGFCCDSSLTRTKVLIQTTMMGLRELACLPDHGVPHLCTGTFFLSVHAVIADYQGVGKLRIQASSAFSQSHGFGLED